MDRSRPSHGDSRRRALKQVLAVACCSFVALLAFLSFQMLSGDDPALGPKTRVAEATGETEESLTSSLIGAIFESDDEEEDHEDGDSAASVRSGAS